MKGLGNVILFLCYIVVCTVTIVGLPLLAVHLFCMIKDAKKREEKAKKKLENSLIEGEVLEFCALALRPYALFNRRAVVGVTNNRVLYLRRPILGGFKMTDVQWKDTHDAELSENIIPNYLGAHFYFSHREYKSDISINTESEIAHKMYKYAQKQEQEWEEKNRIRHIEETRAKAGGVHIASPSATPSAAAGSKSIAEQIQEAKKMMDDGIISDTEFNEMKAKILSKWS